MHQSKKTLCSVPDHWIVDARCFMYAFHLHPANAYSCYLTDLGSVWAETASRDDVAERARALGLSRVDSDTLGVLESEIQAAFDDKSVHIKQSGDLYIVSVDLPNLTWKMRLQKMDPPHAASFLASLNISQFANHSYLAYKVSQLEKALRAKDKYTLYLEENYKTVNGTVLMDKYRRQNADDAPFLQPYSRGIFDGRVRESYGSLGRKLEADPGSRDSLIWNLIDSVTQDVQTWKAGQWIQSSDTAAVKTEQDTMIGEPTKVKTEERSVDLKNESPSPKVESPSKRRRVGILGLAWET
ncbi:uncharacterized protein CXQ87_003247 [Candidozyma duobushaemuli]|uniref:XLF-like N-terminal domain-containing protein n=1 Tax=Candidozyma duobushaemuli TaxID=1231522 RepID=A0A2V1AAJ8_9ASCO|nr:uncharacterized protein CXQ87_003247 [[Candida] duobushaemulonis]PVH15407.1 hypothetical protein CXQ87_003247 [[Candida] duobushaemulonis]